VPTDKAVIVAVERGLDTLALDAIAAGADPARVLTHVEHNLAVDGAETLGAAELAALVTMETGGALTATQAKTVLAELVARAVDGRPGDPAAIAASLGFEAMDTGALDAAVDAVIAANPSEWERFKAGDPKERGKLTGFFVGAVMKSTKGKADGKAVTAALSARAGG
jgi:aspartyl-tRNA(Asn)/glutamyl-tRNA(Gln) amidotransferase subunit B